MKYQELYRDCILCPRECHVDRYKKPGVCGMGSRIVIARAALHYWEEPCISGNEGSGTVFFSGCNLHCSYCQNREISDGFGREITCDRLADIFLDLQNQNANNINLVTPTHFSPDIIYAVKKARAGGLEIPVVYNTSGYENDYSVRMLRDTVDVFLTDFKYYDDSLALKYSHVKNYRENAEKALESMIANVGEPKFDNRGIMEKGVIVRHLVIPGHSEDSKKIIRYLYETYGDRIIMSIMNQFTPIEGSIPDVRLTEEEYADVIDFAEEIGVENAYIQEGETAAESFIPVFDLTGVE